MKFIERRDEVHREKRLKKGKKMRWKLRRMAKAMQQKKLHFAGEPQPKKVIRTQRSSALHHESI